MKHIDFYLDFVSPYAYLAFEQLPETLEGLSCSVSYRPVLLGALFKHHGHVAPVAVPSKREWIYRHVLWLGHAHGIRSTRCRTCAFRSRRPARSTARSAAGWPKPSSATSGAAVATRSTRRGSRPLRRGWRQCQCQWQWQCQ
jgi:2-hydroxychromene-2-carboxylate isomerase